MGVSGLLTAPYPVGSVETASLAVSFVLRVSGPDGCATRGGVMEPWMVAGIVLGLAITVCGFIFYKQLQSEEMKGPDGQSRPPQG